MSLLDDVMIAAPCNLAWDEMPGDDRVRHCTGCSKNVYNISAMTKSEAEQFLERNGTTECMRLYRRVDGTIVTDNCPVGLRRLRDRARKVLRFTAALISNLIAVTCALAHEEAPRALSKQADAIPTTPWPNKTMEAYDGYPGLRPHSSNAPAHRKGTTFLGAECSSSSAGNDASVTQLDPPRMFLGKPARPAQGYSTFGIPASIPKSPDTASSGKRGATPGNSQLGNAQHVAADTTAHTLFVNAQAEEFRGNYIISVELYVDALTAARKNSSSDPEFVRTLESSLLRVRSHIQNPGTPSIQEQLNSTPAELDQK